MSCGEQHVTSLIVESIEALVVDHGVGRCQNHRLLSKRALPWTRTRHGESLELLGVVLVHGSRSKDQGEHGRPCLVDVVVRLGRAQGKSDPCCRRLVLRDVKHRFLCVAGHGRAFVLMRSAFAGVGVFVGWCTNGRGGVVHTLDAPTRSRRRRRGRRSPVLVDRFRKQPRLKPCCPTRWVVKALRSTSGVRELVVRRDEGGAANLFGGHSRKGALRKLARCRRAPPTALAPPKLADHHSRYADVVNLSSVLEERWILEPHSVFVVHVRVRNARGYVVLDAHCPQSGIPVTDFVCSGLVVPLRQLVV